MAVTVGTDSYLTLAEFKAQADALARDYSSYTDAQIEAALIESSLFYIDVTFKFKGTKLSDTQPMALPTTEVAIPDIAKGAFQSAWQALTGYLFVDQSVNANGEIIREKSRLATLEDEVEYRAGTRPKTTYDTSRVEASLRPYLVNQSGAFMVAKGYS